jgi:hypothetical protein
LQVNILHQLRTALIADFTGASNAVFSLALSLVTGNVGGTTKKVIASAVIFVGVAVGNIVGPYAFIESGEYINKGMR